VTPDDNFEWTDAEIIEETKPGEPPWHRSTEEDYAAAILRDVEISISNLEGEVDDLDLLRELILQNLTFSHRPGGGAETDNEQHKAH
jgi:hypothetical protein